jgi:hypothetical protein
MLVLNRNTVKLVFSSVDWGFTNPGVMQVWAVDGDGRMYLVHEVYRTGKLIEWWAERGRAIKAHFGPECFVCDPSEPAYIERFIRSGLYAVPANNDVAPGIQEVQSRLAVQPDGRPRLMMYAGALADRDESLVEARKPCCTREELDVYSWPKGADGRPVKEVPVKVNDHGADAMRYACMWLKTRGSGDPSKIVSGGRMRLPPGVFGHAGRAGGADARRMPEKW